MHAATYNAFYQQRHLLTRYSYKLLRGASFVEWESASAATQTKHGAALHLPTSLNVTVPFRVGPAATAEALTSSLAVPHECRTAPAVSAEEVS